MREINVKKILLPFILFFCLLPLSAQESLKSVEEEYYDFLSLRGFISRPYLNYRAFSDSTWTIGDTITHPWQNQSLGTKRQLFNNISLRIYGPELFSSFNTAVPYGQNDGALWQGKGLNASLSGGVRLEGYGVELTFKPQLAFSQNLPFELVPSSIENPYGYFWSTVDAPQRFGDRPFIVFDWGETEIRYAWKTLTAGFGNQAIWLGPAYLNPILHSNNAPPYPKFDIGLRRQPVTIPWINVYMGDIEARLWIGQLTESAYFDSDPSNNHTMFHGFSFAYAPSFLPGLTLSVNRVSLVAWKLKNIKYFIPSADNVEEDQKASFGASWTIPQVGLEIYGELGIDDFVQDGWKGYIRYPFHTMVYTAGLKKTIPVLPAYNMYGELIFEWNSREMSQDFQFQWPYSFYFHHQITQGYTNRGQWLGTGSGWNGNSQYLEFRLYYPDGASSVFIHRNNPDNNFIYSKSVFAPASDELAYQYWKNWSANLIIGLKTSYFLTDMLSLGGGLAYNTIINPQYYYKADPWQDVFEHNFSLHLLLLMHL